jgi:hypothetical protein
MADDKTPMDQPESRRSVMSTAMAAVGIGLLTLSAPRAKAAVGEENVTLGLILTQAKNIYETAKKYQDTFNKYADEANSAFTTIDKTHALIDRIRNIDDVIEQQRLELSNFFKNRRKGNWTKFRVQKLDIDSWALVSEIKYLSGAISREIKKITEAESAMGTRNEGEREETSGRRRIMSRVGHTALQVHQGKLFYEASKQSSEERRKEIDGTVKLDHDQKAKAFALDSIPELLEIERQQLRATLLLNEQMSTLIEILGLKRPIASRDNYIPNESDFKTATDKTQDGDFDWSPGGGSGKK